jgi:hypothetical protein
VIAQARRVAQQIVTQSTRQLVSQTAA